MNLLDPSDLDDQIMRAEILRELGVFDEALALLTGIESRRHEWGVEFVTALYSKNDPQLAKFD